MERVVIDTNILYSLTGISENDKVKNSNIRDYNLAITTTSLVEAIVKHAQDLQSIQSCIKPVINQEIEIVSIGHTPISNEILYKLYLAKQLTEVDFIIKDIKSMKISREAEFYRFLLILVIAGLLEAIREDGYKFENEDKHRKQMLLVQSMLEPNMDLFLDYFKQEIQLGYDHGREQQAAIEAFQFKIIALLKIFHFNYHMIKENCFPGNDSNEKIKNLETSLDNDNFHKKLKKYVDSPISYVSRKKFYPSVDKYLKIMKAGISDLDGLTEKSLDYLLNILESAYKDQKKIRKNDIFDFLIVISLNLPDTKIVTLDKAFLKGLQSIDVDSYELCEKLGFVS